MQLLFHRRRRRSRAAIRRGAKDLRSLEDRNPVLRHQRLHHRQLLSSHTDLAGVDLLLRDPACFGRAGGDQRMRAALNLACTTSRHQHLAIIRIESWSQSSSGSSPKGSCCWPEPPSIPKASSTGFSRSCEFDSLQRRGDLQHPARSVGDRLRHCDSIAQPAR